MDIEKIQYGLNSLETILNSRTGELISHHAPQILSICRDIKAQSTAYRHELDLLYAESNGRLEVMKLKVPTVQQNLSALLSHISELQKSIVSMLEDDSTMSNSNNATVIQYMQNELNSYKRMFVECYKLFLLA